MKCPVLALAGFFALGIVLARDAPAAPAVYLAACCVCAAAGWLMLRRGHRAAAVLLVSTAFLLAGSSAARVLLHRFPPDHISHLAHWGFDLNQPVLVRGTLATPALLMPYGIQFDLRVMSVTEGGRSHRASGKVRIRVLNGRRAVLPAGALGLRYGSTITALARLDRPHNYQNPGSFDYRRWLESIQDIYWQGIVPNPAEVQKLAGPKPPLFRRIVEGARGRISASIEELFPPWSVNGRDGAVLKAVLLGDRSALDSATVENFRASGLYHLLVVAGLHVGLLALLAEGFLRLLRFRRFWRTLILLALLAVYAALVEQRAPTLRATLMIGAYLVARLLDREQPALNAIGLAALILLAYWPAWLFDSGFQLSFAAALLIAGLAAPVVERTTEPLRRALRRIREPAFDLTFEPRWAQFRLDLRGAVLWLGKRGGGVRPELAMASTVAPIRAGVWLADLIIFSAVVQLGLLLPMASTFHRVTLAGIGLNALALPLMTLLLALAVPTVLLGTVFPAIAAVPGKLLAVVMNGLFALTELPRFPGWLSFRVPSPPAWVGWGFALALIAAALFLSRSRRIFGLAIGAAAVFGLLIALHPLPPRTPGGALRVTALDCGGGEALVINLPDRSTMLVGAGGGSRRRIGGGDPFRARRWDPGENIVAPYLWSRGISRIDVLMMPELRGDDLSGVASVLRDFKVREFWYGSLPPEPAAAELLALCRHRGVRVVPLRPGGMMPLGGASVRVLWPLTSSGKPPKNSADSPLIVRLVGADGSIIIAGDPGRGIARRLIRSDEPLESSVAALSGRSPEEMAPLVARIAPRVVLLEGLSRRREGFCSSFAAQGETCVNAVRDGAATVTMRHGDITIQRLMPRP